MEINAAWHAAHPMPEAATLEQRLDWHAAHAAHCGCRPIPPKLQAQAQQAKAKGHARSRRPRRRRPPGKRA